MQSSLLHPRSGLVRPLRPDSIPSNRVDFFNKVSSNDAILAPSIQRIGDKEHYQCTKVRHRNYPHVFLEWPKLSKKRLLVRLQASRYSDCGSLCHAWFLPYCAWVEVMEGRVLLLLRAIVCVFWWISHHITFINRNFEPRSVFCGTLPRLEEFWQVVVLLVSPKLDSQVHPHEGDSVSR